MGAADQHIAASVSATLAEQARRNEVRIGYVRVVCFAITAVADVIAHRYPPRGLDTFSLDNAVTAAAMAALSAAFLVVLVRGYWRPWLRLVLPFADAAAVGIIAVVYWRSGVPEAFDYSGVVALLIALSGGLRLHRGASAAAALAGVAVFLFVQVMNQRDPVYTLFVLTVIVGGALLAYWMNAVVRSAVTGEVARITLGRFLPAQVIEGAHRDPIALVGEARQVEATVLVSDLRGFTALAETMAPTETLAFLNEVQGAFARVVRTHGGVVDKFMGDGMLAVFGIAGPADRHAGRAVRAALDMVAALAAINRGRDGRPPVAAGIGVHTGQVVAGCIGDADRLEFTVIGDTVNIASRLEGLCKEREATILISAATQAGADPLPPEVELTPCGELALRGRAAPIAVFTAERHGE